MSITTKGGQGRMANLEAFSIEIQPIMVELNALIKKYNIYPIDDIVIFRVHKNEVVPFVSYDKFPSSNSK